MVYVVGDMAGKLDSPLYGMFDIRSRSQRHAAGARRQAGRVFHPPAGGPLCGYALKWDGEWQVTYETFRDMGIAYAVGLVLIYLLVVAQFESYLMPLIIMAPIPLTIIGVMPGHALLGAQFTATSMIGMIALAGIIVRNSILLVDFINLQVRDGVDLRAAVIDARRTRAQADRADRPGGHAGRAVHPRRPDIQRPGDLADLRHLGLHRADAGGDSGAVLREQLEALAGATCRRGCGVARTDFES